MVTGKIKSKNKSKNKIKIKNKVKNKVENSRINSFARNYIYFLFSSKDDRNDIHQLCKRGPGTGGATL